MTTMVDLLARMLRHDAGRPFLTSYDGSSGERVELSATTYANWISKAGALLVEEHDLSRGDVLLVDLPAHWLGPVFLGAAWSTGVAVAFPDSPGADRADAVVTGPEGLARWGDRAGDVPVLACSLLPMGVRFADPLPPGVHDVGIDVWSQPDGWQAWDPPVPEDTALVLPDGVLTQGRMWEAAAAGTLITDDGRLLTGANPASPPGFAALTEPLARSGSLVLVSRVSPARLDEIATAERVTHRA